MRSLCLALVLGSLLAATGCTSSDTSSQTPPGPTSANPAAPTPGPSRSVQVFTTPSALPATTLTDKRTVTVGRPVRALSFTADGQSLAVLDGDGTLTLYAAASGKPSLKFPVGGTLLRFSTDGRFLYTSSDGRTISVRDAASGAQKSSFTDSHGKVVAAAPRGDDSLLAIAAGNEVALFDASGTEKIALKAHQAAVTSVAWAPDWSWIVSGSQDRSARIFDATSGAPRQSLEHGAAVLAVAVSADGRQVATAGSDKAIKLWDVTSGKLLRTLEGHTDAVAALAYSHGGLTLVSGAADGTVRIWPLVGNGGAQTLSGHRGAVDAIAISPDGHQVISGSLDGTVRFWEQNSALP